MVTPVLGNQWGKNKPISKQKFFECLSKCDELFGNFANLYIAPATIQITQKREKKQQTEKAEKIVNH